MLKINYEKFITRLQKKKIYPYLYLLPIVPFAVIFFIYPFVTTTILSFAKWDGLRPINEITFMGLEHFKNLFKDSRFWRAFQNTLIFVVITVILQNVIGFIHAYILFYSGIKFSKIWRAIIFFPVVLAPVIVALVWKLMFDYSGLINLVLERVGLDFLKTIWLGNKITPKYLVALVNVWQWTGMSMVFYYAGLQTIPEELIEAAKIDGASWFNIIKNILLPLLKPISTIVILLTLIGGFKVFDIVFIMTGGGPARSSEVIATYMFWQSFSASGPSNMGYASLIALMLTIIVLIISYIRIKFERVENE